MKGGMVLKIREILEKRETVRRVVISSGKKRRES